MAFYGNKFLKPGHMGLEPDPLSPAEQGMAEELAEDLLLNAQESNHENDAKKARRSVKALQVARGENVPGAMGLRTMEVRVAGYLDKISWFGRGTVDAASMVKQTLAQVTRYMKDREIHDAVVNTVTELLSEETLAVIGHSLGSVVAYDAVRAYKAERPIPLLLTLGCPLALSAIRTRLQPQPPSFPAAVRRWVNIASEDDVVAARPNLLEFFDGDRPAGAILERTVFVDNGSAPHDIEFYLGKKECGEAVTLALEGQ
jgi:hypothetical protein